MAERRRAGIVALLGERGSVTVAEVEQRFGISAMTARRDLADLVRQGLARRTHGGILSPTAAPPEVPFERRLDLERPAKEALARAAGEVISPGETFFLDASTTSYFLALRVLELGLRATVLTNSLPVIQLVSVHGAENLEVVAVGGRLRRLTGSFVGPDALAEISGHFADRAFLSVAGVTRSGQLGEADPLEAAVKRAMVAQARDAVALVDHSKLQLEAEHGVLDARRAALVLGYRLSAEDVLLIGGGSVRLRTVEQR